MDPSFDYSERIRRHYESGWSNKGKPCTLTQGPVDELPREFHVLEFPPSERRSMWTYATCGMSQPDDSSRIEVHLHAPAQSPSHVELLTAISHYHRTGRRIGLGHTVNFGRPWLSGSDCDHGLISLPYLDGPDVETLSLANPAERVRCLWLIPITLSEVEFKRRHGLEALESKLEQASFNYLDAARASVV